jgi:hypothetical protein
MNLNSRDLFNHGLELQPCPDCPYPMNILINRLGPKDNCERFAVSCRECGDSWTEIIEIGDVDENLR